MTSRTRVIQRELEVPFTVTRSIEEPDDGLSFEGYAAVFGAPAHVRDQDGEYDEVIARGAFKKTIAERMPQFLFNHGKHPVIDKMPLGRITELREDELGLFVRARMSDNWLVAPVRDAIAEGAIRGMSVHMDIYKMDWAGDKTLRCKYGSSRTVREAGLRECGPVTEPVYAGTSASLRSALRSMNEQFADAIRIEFPEAATSEFVVRSHEIETEVEAAEGTSTLEEGTSEEAVIEGTSREAAHPTTSASRDQARRQILVAQFARRS